MNNKTHLFWFLSSCIALLHISCNNTQHTSSNEDSTKVLTISEVHLGEHMRDIQYYTLKLGLSLQYGNQPLTNFYIDEVMEAYEEIVVIKIEDEGIDISALLNQLLEPQLQQLKTVIEQNDTGQFIHSYQMLIQTCNTCHNNTKHEFIKIEVPKQDYNGQNFSQSTYDSL